MDSRCCKDCKVISKERERERERERETTQHRVVVLDIYIRKWRRRVLDKEKQRLSGGV